MQDALRRKWIVPALFVPAVLVAGSSALNRVAASPTTGSASANSSISATVRQLLIDQEARLSSTTKEEVRLENENFRLKRALKQLQDAVRASVANPHPKPAPGRHSYPLNGAVEVL